MSWFNDTNREKGTNNAFIKGHTFIGILLLLVNIQGASTYIRNNQGSVHLFQMDSAHVSPVNGITYIVFLYKTLGHL